MRRTVGVLVASVAILCATGVCRADARAPVVLVLLERPDEAASLVQSEIAAAGLTPAREMLALSDAGPSELAAAARANDARGVLRLKTDRVEIWIVREDVGLVFLESIPRGASAEDDAMAVRGVERVRAALHWDGRPAAAPTEVPLAAPPPSADVSEEPTPSVTRGLASQFVIGAGAAVLASQGGVDPIGSARGALGWNASEHARVELSATLPFTHSEFERAAGSARVTTSLGALSGMYIGASPSNRLRPFVLGSAGFMMLSASGDAVTPNTSGSGHAYAPFVAAGGGALFRIAPHLSLRADATLGAALAPLRVGILDHAEASVSAPLVTAGLGVEGLLAPW